MKRGHTFGCVRNIYDQGDYDKWRVLYDRGMTDREIAEKTGAKKTAIQHWRVRQGLDSQKSRKQKAKLAAIREKEEREERNRREVERIKDRTCHTCGNTKCPDRERYHVLLYFKCENWYYI